MAQFRQITIVGVGLIGGSLGMAIRKKRLARKVVGLSRKRSTLQQAKRRGAIDVGTTSARAAVEDAELVILTTPVDTIGPLGRSLARYMGRGGILTDAGSAKARIVAALDRRLPNGVAFVGGHPLAGSERRGIASAERTLFDDAVCVVTPTARTSRRALNTVRRLWQGVGARVLVMSPAEHDRVLAGTSHLPHLVAACLSRAVEAGCLPKAPHSFLTMTRIAKSDPDLWDDIFLHNRDALLKVLADFELHVRAMRQLIWRSRAGALRQSLARAKAKRDALQDA